MLSQAAFVDKLLCCLSGSVFNINAFVNEYAPSDRNLIRYNIHYNQF